MKFPALQLRPDRHVRSGVTLVELVMSLVILSILMLAMNGVILLAAKATPDGRSRPATIVQTAKAVDTLSADVRFATALLNLSSTSIELTTADADGNGMADRVKYSWSGVDGDPLLRQCAHGDVATNTYTYGDAVAVATNVREFSLVADRRAVQATQTYSTGAEQLFASNFGAFSLSNTAISSGTWVAQYVKPVLPTNAASWAITRVVFQARVDGLNDGQTLVEISPATSSNLPSGVLDQYPLAESTLTTSFANYTAAFTKASGLSPSQGACVIFAWVSAGKSCDVQYQTGLSGLFGFNMLNSSNGGQTWNTQSMQSLNCSVYGTVTTPDPVAYLYYLTGVRVVLRTGSDATCRIATTARPINEPRVQ